MSEVVPAASPNADPVKRYLLRNPAVAVTLAYLLLTTIGVTFSYMHYSRFGISIFDYWQPSDLVLAGFREPASFLYAIAAVLLGWFDYRYDIDQPRRLAEQAARFAAQSTEGPFGWYTKLQRRMVQEQLDVLSGKTLPFQSNALLQFGRWVRANRVAVQVAISLVIYFGVVFVHTEVRHKRADAWFPGVVVALTAAQAPVLGDAKAGRQVLIGASNSYLFLAADKDDEVTVVPVSSVASFKVEQLDAVESLREAFLP